MIRPQLWYPVSPTVLRSGSGSWSRDSSSQQCWCHETECLVSVVSPLCHISYLIKSHSHSSVRYCPSVHEAHVSWLSVITAAAGPC